MSLHEQIKVDPNVVYSITVGLVVYLNLLVCSAIATSLFGFSKMAHACNGTGNN